MLDEAEKEGKEDLVSFLSHERAFAIHKPRYFVSEIMPRYFTTSRMSSFQRQLNLYGFRRITEGHERLLSFVFLNRPKEQVCKNIKRKKQNVNVPPNLFDGASRGLGPPHIMAGAKVHPYHASSSQNLLLQQALHRNALLERQGMAATANTNMLRGTGTSGGWPFAGLSQQTASSMRPGSSSS
jgi:hypothetical protein